MSISHFFRNLPTLETDRLWLRKLTRADAADVFAYAADGEVATTTTWQPHRTLAQSRQFIERVLQRYEHGRPAAWAVVLKSAQRVIGTCGFTALDTDNNRGEIGYALGRAYWGQGLMTEAVTAVLPVGFHVLNLERIEATCLRDNIASARVLEKAGMAYEGTLRHAILLKGAYHDLCLHAIIRSDLAARAPE